MNIKEVQRVVGQIKANLFHNSNSFSVGMLKSHFRGSGLQFREHRIYTHGDDVRFIDWKMLAKTQKPYIRTFEEDRNVEICVVIDASQAMFLGYNGITKFQAAIEICCLLYLLSKESGDLVHAIVVGDEVLNVPKASGEKGIAALVSVLEKNNYLASGGQIIYPEGDGVEPDVDARFREIMRHLGRRREIVILSDFDDFLQADHLKRLINRRNVHGFRLLAPLDKHNKLPFGLFAKLGYGQKSKFVKASSKGNSLDKILGGKVKDLDIEDRYLECFVKEMI